MPSQDMKESNIKLEAKMIEFMLNIDGNAFIDERKTMIFALILLKLVRK